MFNQNIDTRSVTFNLIAINVVLFAISFLYPPVQYALSLHYLFNTHHYIENSSFQPFQVITHMFMHGSISHIFFNMFGLYMFGTVLERVWGAKRFLLFYFITGFGAVVLHMLVQAIIVHNFTGSFDPTAAQINAEPGVMETYFSSTVGASGALFGILIGFGMLFPNTELMLLFFPVPIKAKYFVTMYVILELYMGISMSRGDNVAHFAHLGGALFGFILVKIWNRNRDYLY
jgi:rhomboid-like protein